MTAHWRARRDHRGEYSGPKGFAEEVEHRPPCARGVLRMIADAGNSGHGVGIPFGGRSIRISRSSPECVLGSAIDVYAPVGTGLLERAAESQNMFGGAKGVLGTRA